MIITGEQIRAALGALKWSRQTLSDKSGVNARTIQRIAESNGIPNSNANFLSDIADTFEAAGIKFVENGIIFKHENSQQN